MRILLFSTLFPNAAMPAHGVFVANRLEAYRKKYNAEIKVVAPVPWFPFRHRAFGAYADWARVPAREQRGDVEVLHPRYLVPPKTAMRFGSASLMRCLRKTVRHLNESGWDFDFIDAHYFYPDGVAAAQIAREFQKPLAITARGTDVNLIPEFPGPRRAIVNAAIQADAVITVAAALKDALVNIGAPSAKITVLRNGVDLELFHETDRQTARRALGLEGLVLASVGHLIERKGHDLVIKALPELPGATLMIVGEGPARAALQSLAREIGVFDRVKFLGQAPHEELPEIYSAADILVLASSREGWPNVLLEAMACGAPCVATDVWGNREIITSPELGRLADNRSPENIAEAVQSLSKNHPGRRAVRAYAEKYSWDETVDGMATIFNDLKRKNEARVSLNIRPVAVSKQLASPKLILTVDTEEHFDWRKFDNVDHSPGEVAGVERFQNLCMKYGVRPLYFLTWPLLKHDEIARYFQSLKKTEMADCGLHLHQWATPPGVFDGEFYSFQKNLPANAHRNKLQSLAQAFQDVFGETAVSHRAGRYGIALEDYPLLAQIGIEYDFSPSASFDFSETGGPDFSQMSNCPFAVETGEHRVYVTPVCGAKAIKRTRMFLNQEKQTPGFPVHRAHYFKKHTIPMRLSPEGAALADMKALTKRIVKGGAPVLTYTLHSTSLTAGGNEYAPNKEHVDQLLENTERYLYWFKDELGGELSSLEGLQQLYKP
ncbi:glycosyltransferase [Hyphococcus sp.]|uniref:glycosyltransferase n=1 Tax=Hyphococcus sp. TaxID=2038636 RepID=UPI003CCC03E3